MPKLIPQTNEQRLREALLTVLERIGQLPPSPGERTDENLIWLASRVELRQHEFAVAPELDKDLLF